MSLNPREPLIGRFNVFKKKGTRDFAIYDTELDLIVATGTREEMQDYLTFRLRYG